MGTPSHKTRNLQARESSDLDNINSLEAYGWSHLHRFIPSGHPGAKELLTNEVMPRTFQNVTMVAWEQGIGKCVLYFISHFQEAHSSGQVSALASTHNSLHNLKIA